MKASWAVPMVACPLTRVPMMAPQTIQGPAFPLPPEKSSAELTFFPDQTPTPTMMAMVAISPRT